MDGRSRRLWIVPVLGAYLILAAILPAIDDEVYYWCWSKDLQWSYYDHPPMTAVLIRLSTSLFGDSVFAFRVPACIASAFVLYVISRLTRSKLIVLGVLLSPMYTLGAVVITPDSPLVMFWAAYLWWLIELHRRLQGRDSQAATSTTDNGGNRPPYQRKVTDPVYSQRASDNPILNPSCDAHKPAVPDLRRESRDEKVESRQIENTVYSQRASDNPILNPSCDAHKPAVPDLRRESRDEKVESRQIENTVYSQRASDNPILNPSCDAHKPAVPGFWVLGGVILGCGVLSKYTMGLAVPTAFISLLLIWRSWRTWLPGYVLHGVVAFVVASPILIYNINQNFEPILFQLGHAAERSKFGLISFGDFVGGQIVLFGTLPFCLLPWVCYNARRLTRNPRLRVCACFYALPMLFFLYKSMSTRLQGNWAFVCYVSFWPVASVWYECVRKSQSWRVSTALAFLPPTLAVVLVTAHLVSPFSIVPVQMDRVYRTIAMNSATRLIAEKIREHGDAFPVYASSYQVTSLLRFQSLDARQIDGATRPSHFTRPPRHLTDVDRAYFVGGMPLEPEFAAGFGPPELIGSVPVEFRGRTDVTFHIWLYSKDK